MARSVIFSPVFFSQFLVVRSLVAVALHFYFNISFNDGNSTARFGLKAVCVCGKIVSPLDANNKQQLLNDR